MTFMEELRLIHRDGVRAERGKEVMDEIRERLAGKEFMDEIRRLGADSERRMRASEASQYFARQRTKCAAGEQMGLPVRLFWQTKSVNEDGSFQAYGSVWGGPDCEGDHIYQGAFARSIRKSGSVPLLWMHNSREPVGRARDLTEDKFGLRFRGQLENVDSPRGREAYAFLKNGHLDSFSIGYHVPPGGATPRRDGGRDLRQIELFEISVVTIPCCGGARIHQG